MISEMNEHFVQSELEYRRQQRLAAAAEYRRGRSAARAGRVRSRLAALVGPFVPARTRDRWQHEPAADHNATVHAA